MWTGYKYQGEQSQSDVRGQSSCAPHRNFHLSGRSGRWHRSREQIKTLRSDGPNPSLLVSKLTTKASSLMSLKPAGQVFPVFILPLSSIVTRFHRWFATLPPSRQWLKGKILNWQRKQTIIPMEGTPRFAKMVIYQNKTRRKIWK